MWPVLFLFIQQAFYTFQYSIIVSEWYMENIKLFSLFLCNMKICLKNRWRYKQIQYYIQSLTNSKTDNLNSYFISVYPFNKGLFWEEKHFFRNLQTYYCIYVDLMGVVAMQLALDQQYIKRETISVNYIVKLTSIDITSESWDTPLILLPVFPVVKQ